MTDTQATIAQWADETFGPAPHPHRLVARANEEMAEMLRAITSDQPDKAIEEAADVAIVMCRLAEMVDADFHATTGDVPNIWPPDARLDALALACRANQMMALLLEKAMVADDGDGIARAGERITSLLKEFCHRLSGKLADAINAKMAVNRARVWKMDGTGHGYHVRDKTP